MPSADLATRLWGRPPGRSSRPHHTTILRTQCITRVRNRARSICLWVNRPPRPDTDASANATIAQHSTRHQLAPSSPISRQRSMPLGRPGNPTLGAAAGSLSRPHHITILRTQCITRVRTRARSICLYVYGSTVRRVRTLTPPPTPRLRSIRRATSSHPRARFAAALDAFGRPGNPTLGAAAGSLSRPHQNHLTRPSPLRACACARESIWSMTRARQDRCRQGQNACGALPADMKSAGPARGSKQYQLVSIDAATADRTLTGHVLAITSVMRSNWRTLDPLRPAVQIDFGGDPPGPLATRTGREEG